MKRVIVESPYGSTDPEIIERNIAYARACLRDCILRGEAPLVSHLLHMQDGVLRNEIPCGTEAGFVLGQCADACAEKTVVYIDLGISGDMINAMERAIKAKRLIEYRSLGSPWVTDASCEIVQH
ncbi:MAG: hypothetical protein Q7R73_03010 [bacterium]|nr:hypothetical protein [bacterium]